MNTLIVLCFEVLCVLLIGLLMGWDRQAFHASAPWFIAAVAIAFVGDLNAPAAYGVDWMTCDGLNRTATR